MIFVEDGNGPKQIFMILLHIMSMIKQQKYTCDWTWTRIVNEWMYSLRLLHSVNIWCSRESDEKRPISNFPKLSESKLFCLRARLSTNNQSLRLWFRVSTEELYLIAIWNKNFSKIIFVHYWRAVNLVQLKTQTLLDKVMKRIMVSALHCSHSRTLTIVKSDFYLPPIAIPPPPPLIKVPRSPSSLSWLGPPLTPSSCIETHFAS